ncbi:MAG: hypothetical protein R3F34_07635 [Planctomycetota bacterium]
MFVRATLELERTPETTVVPYAALTTRGGETGVFVLAEDGKHVAWRPVVVGVREGDVVEVRGDGVTGSVVTLGQELCDDGKEAPLP